MGWKEAVKDFLSAEPPTARVLRRALEITPSVEVAVGQKADVEQKYGSDVENTFFWLSSFGALSDDLSPWGNFRREEELRILWKKESLLAGAMASMTQKMVSLGWNISGTKNAARRGARVLFDANDGRGWSDFISKYTQDFLSQDKGVFVELGRMSRQATRVEAVWIIDSAYMRLRRDPAFPYLFNAPSKDPVKVPWEDVFNTSSMPSPIDAMLSLGFCAVSRSAKAAALLIALYQYDADKLSAMPPQGIAAISGMTERQVVDALKKYKASMEQQDTLIYPGVLWLASMTGDVKVSLTEFSTLPDAFSREEIIQIYVNTLALDFGVDPREFWPATVAGATRADALVQAMKAKGKGPGELISVTERAINRRVLPEGVAFRFDFQDDEEDELESNILLTKIRGIVSLYKDSVQFGQEPLVDRDEAREILGKLGVIPRELMANADELISDTGGFRAREQPEVFIQYHHDILEETDMTQKWFYSRPSTNGSKATRPDPLGTLNLTEAPHD